MSAPAPAVVPMDAPKPRSAKKSTGGKKKSAAAVDASDVAKEGKKVRTAPKQKKEVKEGAPEKAVVAAKAKRRTTIRKRRAGQDKKEEVAPRQNRLSFEPAVKMMIDEGGIDENGNIVPPKEHIGHRHQPVAVAHRILTHVWAEPYIEELKETERKAGVDASKIATKSFHYSQKINPCVSKIVAKEMCNKLELTVACTDHGGRTTIHEKDVNLACMLSNPSGDILSKVFNPVPKVVPVAA